MIIALLIFILITLTGIVILRTFIKDVRPFVLLPAGMLFGTTLYIFLLNQLSHLLPGPTGITLTSVLMIIIFVYLLHRANRPLLFSKISLLSFIIPAAITLVILYSVQARMRTIAPAADSTIQWAYAGSFARGNYPLKVPWQPDFDPGYHLGAYFFEGAIQSLSTLPWIIIHTLVNIFFLSSTSLLAIFLFWDEKYSYKNLWSVITTSIVFIAFGIVIIAIPTTAILRGVFSVENFNKLANLLTVLPQKGTAGAALVDINSLSYLPARSLSIGLALLVLYFFTASWKKTSGKLVLIILTISTLAFVEESAFLPLFSTLIFLTILSLVPYFQKLYLLKKELIVITLGCLALIIIQGGFITDQFIYRRTSSAFNITLPLKGSRFFEKVRKVKSDNIIFYNQDLGINLITFNPFWLTIFPLLYGLLRKRKELIIISLFSSISLLIFLLVEYKYDLSNNIRFYNFSYIAAGLGVSYMLIHIFRSRSYIWSVFFLTAIIPLVIAPTAGPELYKQITALSRTQKINIIATIWPNKTPSIPSEQIRNWAAKNLPPNIRLFVLGENSLTPENSEQFQYKGIYTIFGPQYIRVLRQEPGIEYFDLTLTLNPSLFKQTKAEYLYIESLSSTYQQLPKFRKDDLENNKYFEVLKSIESTDNNQLIFYRLYKIKPEFLSSNNIKEIKEGTLQQLANLIPNKATVYVSDYGESPLLNFWYRMAIILAIKDKQLIRNPTQTDYMAIETLIPYQNPQPNQTYDYYLLSSTEKPPVAAKLIWSNVYASAWKGNQ